MTKQTKYHTVETTLNIKTVKRGQIDTVNTQIMTADFSVFGTGTSMKNDEAKLALLARNILIWMSVGDVKHHNLDNLSG